MSDDGRFGICVIALIGSVFSPYYAWSGRRDPLNHCAVNVALYGGLGAGERRVKRWTMTERGRTRVTRDATRLAIGPSAMGWEGDALILRIDERTAPFGQRIRGTVRLTPAALPGHGALLDAAGAHRWQPIAPCARVEVVLDDPQIRWSGPGYLDCNHGDAPLEDAFSRWDWSRAVMRDGSTAILYDATDRDGMARPPLGLRFSPAGGVQDFAPPPRAALPMTGWRIARGTQAEGGRASVVRTLEDTPFYARSIIASQLLGEPVHAMHESLSLDRFRLGVVKALLPFRMPRRA